MKEQVKKPVETDQKGKNGQLPPTPYAIGDVVVHTNGERGLVLGSEFFDAANPDYGKKVKVALTSKHFEWAIDDLVDPLFRIGYLVEHKNGATALAVGIPNVGMVQVRDLRQEEVWDVADIEGTHDGSTIVKQSAKIAVLEAELAALKAAPSPSLATEVAPPTHQGGESPVEVKTLIQRLTDAMGKPYTGEADRELARALVEGWSVMDISVDTVFYPGDQELQSVRVVTLEKRHEGEVFEPEAVEAEGKLLEVADEVKPVEAADSPVTKTAARVPFIVTVEHPEPEFQPVAITFHPPVSTPRTISFEEALNNPRMSAAEVAEIGNQIAFERGKAVFEGLQNGSYPKGSFGGMRRSEVRVR